MSSKFSVRGLTATGVVIALVAVLVAVYFGWLAHSDAGGQGGRTNGSGVQAGGDAAGRDLTSQCVAAGDNSTVVCNEGPASTSTPPPSGPRATISEPTSGQKVGTCKVIRGTAVDLLPGMTIVTVKRHDQDAWYVERPRNWDQPQFLAAGWTDTQSFNNAEGQDFSITVFMAPLDFVRAEKAKPENNPTWELKTVPADWQPLTSVDVVVDSRKAKSDCAG